jgi:hypothetical protein
MASGLDDQAALANAPAGARSYAVVSTFSGGHEGARSVRTSSGGPGKTPRVITNTSGDRHAGTAAPVAPAAPNASRMNII